MVFLASTTGQTWCDVLSFPSLTSSQQFIEKMHFPHNLPNCFVFDYVPCFSFLCAERVHRVLRPFHTRQGVRLPQALLLLSTNRLQRCLIQRQHLQLLHKPRCQACQRRWVIHLLCFSCVRQYKYIKFSALRLWGHDVFFLCFSLHALIDFSQL